MNNEPNYKADLAEARDVIVWWQNEYKATQDAYENQLRLLQGERDALEAENKTLRLKAAHSLANNLCADHRDKQQDKPCLACEIDRLKGARQ